MADETLMAQQGRPSMLEAGRVEQVRRVVAMYTLFVTLIIFVLLTMHALATDTYGTDCFLDCSPSIDTAIRPLSATAVGSGIENQARAALLRFWIEYRGITTLEWAFLMVASAPYVIGWWIFLVIKRVMSTIIYRLRFRNALQAEAFLNVRATPVLVGNTSRLGKIDRSREHKYIRIFLDGPSRLCCSSVFW